MSDAAATATKIRTTVSEYKPGEFCWVDLLTPDPDGAKQFYTALFGWQAIDNEIPDGGVYTMYQKNDGPVCAQSKLREEQLSQGVPPHWNAYVSVDDVDAYTQKAKDLGANVMMEPFDVMEVGRMSVIQDPTGATLSLWQPRQHQGATVVNTPGAVTWNELMTRDGNAAKEFYTSLFEWSANVMPVGETEYTMFQVDDWGRAGMMEMDENFPAFIPAHWLTYFAVDDADATVGQAKELGATIQMGPQDIPTVGRFAVITDPQGATFAIIKLQHQST